MQKDSENVQQTLEGILTNHKIWNYKVIDVSHHFIKCFKFSVRAGTCDN